MGSSTSKSSSTISLSSLTLRPATHAQILESHRRTYEEWGVGFAGGKENGGGLSLGEYLDRERRTLEEGECARDGRMRVWVLVNRNDPESLDFLCSCETFKRDAWYVPNDKSEGEACVGYGVASVFTPEKNRGKGYAKHMMRLLHWVLASDEYLALSKAEWPVEWGEKPNRDGHAGDALFSALWSDVGPEFYARCGMGLASRGGWEVLDAKMCVWDVDSVDCSSVLDEEWEWLDEKRVNEVWKDDADMMKHELCAQECTFLPDKGVGDFQIDRKRAAWVKMEPVPRYWGVQHVKEGIQRYATWTIEKREEGKWVMVITRLRGRLEGVIAGFAKKHGVSSIECWGIGDTQRTDHLTAVKWYSTSRFEWRFNEKFCWC